MNFRNPVCWAKELIKFDFKWQIFDDVRKHQNGGASLFFQNSKSSPGHTNLDNGL